MRELYPFPITRYTGTGTCTAIIYQNQIKHLYKFSWTQVQ